MDDRKPLPGFSSKAVTFAREANQPFNLFVDQDDLYVDFDKKRKKSASVAAFSIECQHMSFDR